MRSAEAAAAAAASNAAAGVPRLPPHAAWVFALQASLVVVYLVCAFVLPGEVSFMAEAAHVGTLHALLFVCNCLCAMALAPVFSSRIHPFPFTPLLAAAPLLLAVLANALILPVLGMESWLRDTLGDEFSVLLIVQMLAVAEATGCACAVLAVAWRYYTGDSSAKSSFEAAAAAAAAVRIAGGVAVRRPGFAGGTTAALLQGGGRFDLDADGDGFPPFEQIPQYMVPADRDEAAELLGMQAGGGRDHADPAAAADSQPNLAAAAAADMSMFSAPSVVAGPMGGDASFLPALHSPGGPSAASARGTPDLRGTPQAADGGQLAYLPQPQQHKRGQLLDRLHYLQQRELDLTQRLDALTRELVAAAAGTGQTELPLLLRQTTEELVALQASFRDLQARCIAQQEQLLRNEVRAAATRRLPCPLALSVFPRWLLAVCRATLLAPVRSWRA